MEKVNVCERPLNSFSEDLKGVYDQIFQYRANIKLTDESDQSWLIV